MNSGQIAMLRVVIALAQTRISTILANKHFSNQNEVLNIPNISFRWFSLTFLLSWSTWSTRDSGVGETFLESYLKCYTSQKRIKASARSATCSFIFFFVNKNRTNKILQRIWLSNFQRTREGSYCCFHQVRTNSLCRLFCFFNTRLKIIFFFKC